MRYTRSDGRLCSDTTKLEDFLLVGAYNEWDEDWDEDWGQDWDENCDWDEYWDGDEVEEDLTEDLDEEWWWLGVSRDREIYGYRYGGHEEG